MPTPTDLRAVGLLERAIGYTRSCLTLVSDPLLDHPTPCAQWDLRTLLEHMDDALTAFAEAGSVGRVGAGPAPAPGPDLTARLLTDRLRSHACAVLGAWSADARPATVQVGGPGRPVLDPGVLASVGALEIAVHGWDVARACGADRPLPDALASDLLRVAPVVVGAADRPARFGPEREAVGGGASDRLLALLGR